MNEAIAVEGVKRKACRICGCYGSKEAPEVEAPEVEHEACETHKGFGPVHPVILGDERWEEALRMEIADENQRRALGRWAVVQAERAYWMRWEIRVLRVLVMAMAIALLVIGFYGEGK